jgi:hypothetical protein
LRSALSLMSACGRKRISFAATAMSVLAPDTGQ